MSDDQVHNAIQLSGRSAGHDNESWVFTAPIGRPFYDGYRVREISEDLAKMFLSNFRIANAHFEAVTPEGKSTYRFPFNTEHKSDGKRRGDIIDVKISGSGDEYGIYTKARWLNETWDEIQAGSTAHVSIETKPSYTLEDGTELGPTLTAVAITNQPRVMSIGSIQDTLELTLSRLTLSDIEDSEMDELKELLGKLLSNQEAILAGLTASQEDEDEIEANQDDDEDMPGDPDVIKETVDGIKKIADEVEEIQGSQEIKASKADPVDPEPVSEAPSFDQDAFKEEVLSLARTAVKESVSEALQASRTAHLNLSEKGTESAPPTSKPDFQSRKAQLIKSGLNRDQALQTLIKEGYRS